MKMATQRVRVGAVALALFVAASVVPVLAQTSFATLRGKLADEQGGVLPGVTVTVRHVDTNTTRTAVADALGLYFLPNLPAGAYEVTMELQGFATATRQLVLRVGQEATLDVVLSLAGVQENVVVSAEFGQASGGVLNVITRSGSNTVQGRVYGFFRDDKFDTAPYAGRFVGGKPQFLAAPPLYNQQRWGGFLGGPIRKDKVFFFGGAESLVNDATTVLAISDYWRARGYESVIPSKNTNRVYMIKTDWNANGNNRLSFRHSKTMKEDQNCSGQGGDGCNSSPLWTEEKRATFDGPLWSALGTWTSTISNRAFNELRAYYGISSTPRSGWQPMTRRGGTRACSSRTRGRCATT